MSRWFPGASAAGPTASEAPAPAAEGHREALLRLAAREARMLEGQVNFLTPELLQVDSLVREAAGTLEDAAACSTSTCWPARSRPRCRAPWRVRRTESRAIASMP